MEGASGPLPSQTSVLTSLPLGHFRCDSDSIRQTLNMSKEDINTPNTWWAVLVGYTLMDDMEIRGNFLLYAKNCREYDSLPFDGRAHLYFNGII